jgi:hypothetical protein
MFLGSITVNAPDNTISLLERIDISDVAANSGVFPFSLKNTTAGGLSLAFEN